MPDTRRPRTWLALGGAALGLGALWHVSPVLLWHLRFESQLAGQGDASRLHTTTLDAFPPPHPRWDRITSGRIALRAPLAPEARPACGRCATACRLPLSNRGTVGIFEDPPPESYEEALDRFAPDARDIDPWRSVARNWRTIDALTDRVRTPTPPPRSFRFETPASRGVVMAFHVDGVDRFVVYAYARDGTPARIVGVSGLGREHFERLLGGLRVEPDRAARPSRCVTPASRAGGSGAPG